MKESYDKALALVLKYEGNYVNDPVDRGGATMKGVTQKVYDSFRKLWKLVTQSVRKISDKELGDIYKTGYWDTVGGDALPYPVDVVTFDSAVNCGPGRANRWKDASTNADPKAWAKAIIKLRRLHYATIIKNNPSQIKFKRGWENRVRDLEKEVGI